MFNSDPSKRPCLKCVPPIRKEACHDTCPEYKEWRQKEWENKKRRYNTELTSLGHKKSGHPVFRNKGENR